MYLTNINLLLWKKNLSVFEALESIVFYSKRFCKYFWIDVTTNGKHVAKKIF